MPGWNLIHPVPHNEVGMLGLNVILPVLNFALLCLVTYVLARVKKSAEVTAKKVVAYFNGEKLKKYELVPVYGITKENVGQFATGCSY